MPAPVKPKGLFDQRYSDFLRTAAPIRSRLHRYCARMVGSAMDGEDIVQEALLEAFSKLDQLTERGALQSWVFRIAHNRTVDFLRRRRVRTRAEGEFAPPDMFVPREATGRGPDHAIERLVLNLPPMERACVLLSDAFDHSLEETAELVGTSTGAVKSALHRGRAKLSALGDIPPPSPQPREPDPAFLQLLETYVQLFNMRDWDAVRALAGADARLEVADYFAGRLVDAPYFAEYERASTQWRLEVGTFDGETILMMHNFVDDAWRAVYPIRLAVNGDEIVRIADYCACPWLLAAGECR